jgi:hypothetical protein
MVQVLLAVQVVRQKIRLTGMSPFHFRQRLTVLTQPGFARAKKGGKKWGQTTSFF